MRPIRKQELDYLDRLINNKFQEKQSAIRSQCELEVQKQLDKDFDKFISTLKLDKLIKEAEILTPNGVVPEVSEIESNPSSRSARLRVISKL